MAAHAGRRGLVFVLVACGVLLAACDDEDGDDGEGETSEVAGGVDACELVDSGDVEAAFGGRARVDRFAAGVCTFAVTGSDLGAEGTVHVAVESDLPVDAAQVLAGTCSDTGSVPVDGVGDDACYDESVDAVYARTGDTRFSVQGLFGPAGGQPAGEAGVRGALTQLARAVAEAVRR
jgi:hypothetical protein